MKILIISFVLVATSAAYAADVNVRAWGNNAYGTLNVPTDLTNTVAISSGASHCLALRENGTVAAWGNNDYGQSNVPQFNDIKAIAAGYRASLILRSNGTVVMFGNDTNVPVGLTDVVAISADRDHSGYLALKSDGTIVTWGGADAPPGPYNAVAISCGSWFTLVILSDGRVLGSGSGLRGKFDLINVVAISAGTLPDYFLILTQDGMVWSGNENTNAPVGLSNVVAIAAGGTFNLALKNDGTITAWGNNSFGQLNIPTDLPFVTGISAGSDFGLALIVTGSAPSIVKNPVSQTVAIGSTVYLTVCATNAPVSYQWYFGTNVIDGATNATLILTDVHSSQSGAYIVTVSNQVGSVTSDPAMLNVLPGLGITMVPAVSIFGEVGTNYTLQYINAIGPTNAWNDLATLMLTNSPQFYPDYSAIGQPQRFYRAVQVP